MVLIYTLITCLIALCFGVVAFVIARHLNDLQGATVRSAALPDSGFVPSSERYRPMLRLLAEEDFQTLRQVGWSQKKVRQAKAERRKLFRRYLRCLVKDYSRVLSGLRTSMVQAQTDRPDLARAIARNYAHFALALLRIEFHLALHTVGVSKVDVSNLVNVVETLRIQAGSFAPLQVADSFAAAR